MHSDFYNEILRYALTRYPIASNNSGLIVVAQGLPDATDYIEALNQIAPVKAIIPKSSKALHPEVVEEWKEKGWPVFDNISREDLVDESAALSFLARQTDSLDQFSIIDHGGYFSPHLDAIVKDEKLRGRCTGIVDGSTSGIQSFNAAPTSVDIPYYNHCESDLKTEESIYIGQDIVRSIDRILKETANGGLANRQIRSIGVVGLGKTGRGVLKSLVEIQQTISRRFDILIADSDEAKLEQIDSNDSVTCSLDHIAENSDLIISCTGNKPWSAKLFSQMKDGVMLASITSSDSEFDIAAHCETSETELSDKTVPNTNVRFSRTYQTQSGRDLHLLLDGFPPNYLLKDQHPQIAISHAAKLINAVKSVAGLKLTDLSIEDEEVIRSACEKYTLKGSIELSSSRSSGWHR